MVKQIWEPNYNNIQDYKILNNMQTETWKIIINQGKERFNLVRLKNTGIGLNSGQATEIWLNKHIERRTDNVRKTRKTEGRKGT